MRLTVYIKGRSMPILDLDAVSIAQVVCGPHAFTPGTELVIYARPGTHGSEQTISEIFVVPGYRQ